MFAMICSLRRHGRRTLRASPWGHDDEPWERRTPRQRNGRWEKRPAVRRKPWDAFENAELVYGKAPVLAALKARRREAFALYVDRPSREYDAFDVPVTVESKQGFHDALGKVVHQGVMLCCSRREFAPLDGAADGELWIALDEVQDPRNFGAVLRSARFFGVRVVSCAKNSAPLSPVASKASAGALEEMEVFEAKNMPKFLAKSKENGFHVVGASLTSGRFDTTLWPLQEFERRGPTVLVLGNEGTGLRTNVLQQCDDLVRVEGAAADSGVDSLNVAVTASVILYHLLS